MTWTRFPYQPGIYKDDTPLSAEGFFIDADKIRFVRGKPETIGGWEKATTDAFQGLCRGMHTWLCNNGLGHGALGTNLGLWAFSDGALYRLKVLVAEGSLVDPFATTVASSTISVSQTAHGLVDGQLVEFSGASAVGGILVDGSYTATVIDNDTYSVTASTPASATASGGGNVSYSHTLADGQAHGTGGKGYGTGAFGSGTYGSASDIEFFPRTWATDNWGEDLIANPRSGAIFTWSPAYQSATDFEVRAVANAPTQVTTCFVTSERILVACGCEDTGTSVFDPLRVAWSDQENNTVWSATASNLAGFFTLSKGARIVGALAGRGENYIFTDEGLYLMRFVPDPLVVYRFDYVGSGCGLIGPKAASGFRGSVYWMAPGGQFFRYSGGEPQPLNCTLRRDVFDHLAWVQHDKVFSFGNAANDEIWWLYPDSRDGNEVSRYVSYNVTTGIWSSGRFDRTAWIDAGVFEFPLATSSQGNLYFQEKGMSDDGGALSWSLTTGFFDQGDGDQLFRVDQVMPDFEDLEGGIDLTLRARIYPNGTEFTSGPHGITRNSLLLETRLTGREFQMELTGNAAPAFMRLGNVRADIQSVGGRR